MTQALTGHGSIGSYLFKFKLKDSDVCEICQTEDDIKHKLYECQKYTNKRKKFIEDIEKTGKEWPISQKQMMEEDIYNTFKQYCKNIFN